MKRNQTQYAVWDLDNCLSDDRDRIKLIDWAQEAPDARYAAYHTLCANDVVGNLNIFQAIGQAARPVFFTARPESVRLETTRWVRLELDIEQPIIFMRPNGDARPSTKLKREMLRVHNNHVISQYGAPQLCYAAFDDREEVVDMYRSFQIDAMLLSIHNHCAYTAPRSLK